jgi:hypothetical protein
MANLHLYRRTTAGKLAWQRQDARFPLEYRRVLGAFGDADETHPDNLRGRLGFHSEAELQHVLDELVEQGLLKAVAAGERHDLDFTGELDFSQLRKAGR